MPLSLGRHSPQLKAVQALLTNKGRNEQQRFSFEGLTLLSEAQASGVRPEALYVTQLAYRSHPSIAQMESSGSSVYIVDERTLARLSDLETPSGVLAVTAVRLMPVEALLIQSNRVLLLADLNDPGNAGTLMRSAEAFGLRGVIFGGSGVQPHHPKVVRSAMGAFFRMNMAVASPTPVEAAAHKHGFSVVGSDARGEPIDRMVFPERTIIAVGQERQGLARWTSICDRLVGIRMSGQVESLNAAVAGSIMLYEASKGRWRRDDEAVKTV